MVYMRIIVGYEEVVQCLFLTRLHEDVEGPLFLSNESLKARQFGPVSGQLYQMNYQNAYSFRRLVHRRHQLHRLPLATAF